MNDSMKALCVGFPGRETECNATLVRPQIQIARYKLGTLVDSNRCRESNFSPDSYQYFHDVSATELEARFHGRRKPREHIDDRENSQLAASRQLIMDEVHGPGLVRSRRCLPIASQLRHDPALRCFVAQLQAILAVKSVHPFGIHRPAFTAQQHVNAPITVTNTGPGDLLDPFGQFSLPGSTGAVVAGRSFDRQCAASSSNAYPPGRSRKAHQLTLPGRLQSFRRMTSCSIALSSDRSATIFFSLPFSSSS